MVQIPFNKGQTIVFLIDHANVNLTIPQTIMWKDVNLPYDWIMEKAIQAVPKHMPQRSKIIQTSNGTVKLSFDRPRKSCT